MELYAERVATRGLCAQTQAESLKYKLLGGLAVRRACYGVLRFIMESGAKGAEVVVSGQCTIFKIAGTHVYTNHIGTYSFCACWYTFTLCARVGIRPRLAYLLLADNYLYIRVRLRVL